MNGFIVTIEDGYKIEKYPNGTIVKTLISPEIPEAPQQEEQLQPTLEDKVNYLYYKSLGVI